MVELNGRLATPTFIFHSITKLTSESLKDLMCLGTTWYQLESCRGHMHGSCLTLQNLLAML